MPLLEIRNLTKIFPLGESVFGGGAKGEVRAVDGVSFDIESGETLGLVGESGSGKSTLGRLILRLIEPTSGNVVFDGRDLLVANASEMRRLRRDMQIIFQDPFGSLDPRMRVEDVVAEPLIIHESITAQARRLRVAELLRVVGLDESATRRFPHEFSGGQRQRIGIARALALRPKFIVADEPVSALDVSVGAQIVNLMAQFQREFGIDLSVYFALYAGGSLSGHAHCRDVPRQDRGNREDSTDHQLSRNIPTRAACWKPLPKSSLNDEPSVPPRHWPIIFAIRRSRLARSLGCKYNPIDVQLRRCLWLPHPTFCPVPLLLLSPRRFLKAHA